MERLPAQPFQNPEEEIAFLRAELSRERAAADAAEAIAPEEVVRRYAATPRETVLPPERVMSDHHIQTTALGLSEDVHDDQIEGLLDLVAEKGVKNALAVAEKMDNPHVFDDFHRALVAYLEQNDEVAAAHLSEKDRLWAPLHMSLFEIRLPTAAEEDKERDFASLISGMEQLYAGLSAINDQYGSSGWYSIEIANEDGSQHSSFYVAVPTEHVGLLEKQVVSLFPEAVISARKNDYNIFNEKGAHAGALASLERHSLYPLRPYDEFDVDPLNVLLNSFSKIDRDGEGAAIQFLIGPRRDDYAKLGHRAIESIRKGEPVAVALHEIDRSMAGRLIKGVFGVFKSKEAAEKEKERRAERAESVDQAEIEQLQRKLKTPLHSVTIRVVASAGTEKEAEAIVNDIKSSFSQFEQGPGNRFKWRDIKGRSLKDFLGDFSFREWADDEAMVLNLEELTTICHLPSVTDAKTVPTLRQSKAAAAPAPQELPAEGTLLGTNSFRGVDTPARITDEDRMRHFYIIGQTGTGKTTLMKNMIVQDIEAGHGVCMIDPHGNDIADVLSAIPDSRREDVIYFDPARTDTAIGLNMLEFDPAHPEQKTFVVNELFSIFQKLYGAVPESMGPMFEQYFRNATLLVLEDPESGSTLLDISRVFADSSYRAQKLSKARNPVVTQFWNDIATKAGGEAALENIVPYVTSKFDIFTANDFMRPIIGQQRSSFNFRQVMDERQILLVNLSKGRLGEINANLIGMIIVGKILMAALSRTDRPAGDYPPFFLHMDEFQNVTTDSIAAILSEARKYKLGLTMAHQFIAQLDEKIRDAVFGNVGSLAVFRVGPDDADYLEKQFAPTFTAKDLINIENRQAYLRILANGVPQTPFNISTLPPQKGDPERAVAIAEASCRKYGRPRLKVDLEISSRYLA